MTVSPLLWAIPSYSVSQISVLNMPTGHDLETVSRATSINNQGEVAGYSYTLVPGVGESYSRPFLYRSGSMVDILALMPNVGRYVYGQAYDISNNGQITGYWRGETTGLRVFHYDGIQTKDLGIMGGAYHAVGYGINDSGEIVGMVDGNSAFQSIGGVRQIIGPGVASDISADGKIVGTSSSIGGTGFLFDGELHDLGAVPGTNPGASKAYALNDRGVIAGAAIMPASPSSNAGNFQAVRFEADKIWGLGTLCGSFSVCESAALAVNQSGAMVGWSQVPGGQMRHAVIYRNNEIIDLNLLIEGGDIVLTEAVGINDSGQIVANGFVGGAGAAFILSPVPIPPSALLFLSCIVPLSIRAVRRNTTLLCSGP